MCLKDPAKHSDLLLDEALNDKSQGGVCIGDGPDRVLLVRRFQRVPVNLNYPVTRAQAAGSGKRQLLEFNHL